MELHKQLFIPFFLFFAAFSLFAQNNTYIIYLRDKQGTIGTINNPTNYLSARSIDRKKMRGILIDSTDLPVSTTYINSIQSVGAQVKYTSKWINAVCIKSSPEIFSTVLTFPFVKEAISISVVSNMINTNTLNTTVQNSNYAANYSDLLGITEMHSKGISGKGVMIAITDSGFPGVDTLTVFKHIWQNNQLIHYYDVVDNESNIFNDDNHGTYILSVLAANAYNYTSVAPNADYVLIRTEDVATESKLEEYNWLRAAEIADSCGVDIMSVSLGYTTYDNASTSYSYADMNGSTSIIAHAADIASEKGMIVVCSAGNDGAKSWKYIGTPADAKNVLAVGSVGLDKAKSSFSSFGPSYDGRIKPDLCALGESIYCFKPDGSLFSTGGTSLATPIITGILAGMKEAFPTQTNDELKSTLLQSCDAFINPNNLKGYGVPFFPDIYKYVSINSQESNILIAPNPYTSGKLILKVPQSNLNYQIEIFDNQGKIILSTSYYPQNKMIELNEIVQSFTPGMYFISIEYANARETLKWVKL